MPKPLEDEPLEVASWQMVVGILRTEELPDLATDALVRGVDSPSLRVLAGAAPNDVRESRDLFVATLAELDIPILDEDASRWKIVRATAKAIISGSVDPQAGAEFIWHTAGWQVREDGDLRIFVGLVSQLQDHPACAASLEREIVDAAREMLERSAPRRWIQLRASLVESPLSRSGPSGHEAILVADVPISDRLKLALTEWDDSYRSLLEEWPARGGFLSEDEAELFVLAGQGLAEDLQAELGPTYRVEYTQEATRAPGLKLARHN